MANPKIDQLILELENYLECWKQFNYYLNMARTKQFTSEDENQFLEVKSVLTQGLEALLAAFEAGSPSREEVHSLLSNAPSIRFISELTEGSLRGLENQWHKIFISWQSILGQLKVQKRQTQSQSFWGRLRGEER
jgi:hypothetical protein